MKLIEQVNIKGQIEGIVYKVRITDGEYRHRNRKPNCDLCW